MSVTNDDRTPLQLIADNHPTGPKFPVSPAPTDGPLLDSFGRIHDNLRVSVTDRCNLRCTYCMPEEVQFLDRSELLSYEEIREFVKVAVTLGVRKVRLTGGEPLLRRDVSRLVRMLAELPGLDDIGLTTNGLLLERFAAELRDAGLKRLNVSLDTLNESRFRALARRDGLNQTVAGLMAAKAVGYESIKVNAVAVRGFIEDDVVPLAEFCRQHGFELRFIEYMPIGAEPWERNKMVPAEELLDRLSTGVASLEPVADQDPTAPAVDYAYADGRGRVGVIASVSRPFCRSCNRLRLTAEGKLRNCLFALHERDVKPLLRAIPLPTGPLAELIRRTVWEKWEGHEINVARFVKPARTMHAIGG